MSKSKSFPTLEVVAGAVAAYAHNSSQVVRNTVHDNGARTDSNRQLIADCFEGMKRPFVINDFHRKEAEDIIQYLQQTVILQSLRGSADRFLGQTTELLSNQEISTKDFGIIAWAPKLADDYQRKDRIREVSARYETHSRYVGHVRDRITTDFTLIEKRYIKSMDCWAVYGVDDGDNLLFYWARTLDKICEVGKITARIKDHREDQHRGNARVTVLNYVKVI
jgi:hypothetical protein